MRFHYFVSFVNFVVIDFYHQAYEEHEVLQAHAVHGLGAVSISEKNHGFPARPSAATKVLRVARPEESKGVGIVIEILLFLKKQAKAMAHGGTDQRAQKEPRPSGSVKRSTHCACD